MNYLGQQGLENRYDSGNPEAARNPPGRLRHRMRCGTRDGKDRSRITHSAWNSHSVGTNQIGDLMKTKILSLTIVGLLLGTIVQPIQAQVGRGKFGIGLSAAGNMLNSDWKTNDIGLGASADFSYALGSNWGLASKLGLNTYTGKTSANQSVLSTVFYGNIGLSYDFLRDKPIDPFLFGRVGLAFYAPRIDNGPALTSGVNQMWDMAFGGGVGVDYFIDESWSLVVTAEAGTLTNDWIDGYKGGGSIDMFGQVSVGIRYYLFDRKTVERIVETVRR